MFFILGIDAATWTVIRPNLEKLPSFKKLTEIGKSREITLKEKPISASIWCGMFCGKTSEEHGHDSYVVNGNIVKREDIKLDFIWDILDKEGKKVKALNIPFIVPPIPSMSISSRWALDCPPMRRSGRKSLSI